MTSYQTIETPQDYVNYTFNIGARGITEVAGEMAGLSNTITTILGQLAFKTSEYLTHTETLMIGVGTTAMAAFSSATQEAMKFEQAIANVQAIGGESINARDIGNAAMQYSNKFAMDVNSMTEGLEALSRAGLTATNVMSGVLEEGVKLSKLEGMDLEDSINDLISTTNLLAEDEYDVNSQEYANAVKAMNQHIVSTSESAPINAQNIIQSLQHVGGYASANKIDQDDLFAVIAQLGAKGTKGEMAGTALRAFVAAGQKDQAQRALARIGLNVSDLWDESGDTMLPISEMKQVLDDALEARGYSKQEKLEFYSDFAGYKQANQIMKIDVGEVQEYKKTISEAWDLGKKLDTILGTTHNNIQTLFQTIKNFMTRVGETTLPIINAIVIPLKWGVQLLEAMPFSENIVGMLMAFTGLKAILLLINRVVPSLASMYTSFKSGEERAKGISGHFHNILKDLKQSKNIIDHITDTKYLSNLNFQNGVMGQQSYKQHRDIVRTIYNEYYDNNDDALEWDRLSPVQKEMYYARAEAYKDTDMYQRILNQFNESNLKHMDSFADFLLGENIATDSGNDISINYNKSKTERRQEQGVVQNTSTEISSTDIDKSTQEITNATKASIIAIKSLGEKLDQKALYASKGTTQRNITSAILNAKEALAEAIGRAIYQRFNTKTTTVSEGLGEIQVNRNQEDQTIKQLQKIEAEVSTDLGDIGYFLDYDKEQIDSLLAVVKNDLEQKIIAYSNNTLDSMSDTQRHRMEKIISRAAKTELGSYYSAEQNNINVREFLIGKTPNKNRGAKIRESQIDAIESILNIRGNSRYDKETRLNRIHDHIRTKLTDKAEKKNKIDEILKATEAVWLKEEAAKDLPSLEASKFLTNGRAIHIGRAVGINSINWDDIENPAQALLEYFKDADNSKKKREQLKQADKLMFTFLENNKAENEVFNEAEAQEIGYIIKRYKQLLLARNKRLETSIKNDISNASFARKFDNTNHRFVYYPEEINDVIDSSYDWQRIPTVENSRQRLEDLAKNGIFTVDNNMNELGLTAGGDIQINMKGIADSVLREHFVPKFFEVITHEMSHAALQHTLRDSTLTQLSPDLIIPGALSKEGKEWKTPISEYEAMSVSKKTMTALNIPLPKGFLKNYNELEKLIQRDYGSLDNVRFDLINQLSNDMIKHWSSSIGPAIIDLIPMESDFYDITEVPILKLFDKMTALYDNSNLKSIIANASIDDRQKFIDDSSLNDTAYMFDGQPVYKETDLYSIEAFNYLTPDEQKRVFDEFNTFNSTPGGNETFDSIDNNGLSENLKTLTNYVDRIREHTDIIVRKLTQLIPDETSTSLTTTSSQQSNTDFDNLNDNELQYIKDGIMGLGAFFAKIKQKTGQSIFDIFDISSGEMNVHTGEVTINTDAAPAITEQSTLQTVTQSIDMDYHMTPGALQLPLGRPKPGYPPVEYTVEQQRQIMLQYAAMVRTLTKIIPLRPAEMVAASAYTLIDPSLSAFEDKEENVINKKTEPNFILYSDEQSEEILQSQFKHNMYDIMAAFNDVFAFVFRDLIDKVKRELYQEQYGLAGIYEIFDSPDIGFAEWLSKIALKGKPGGQEDGWDIVQLLKDYHQDIIDKNREMVLTPPKVIVAEDAVIVAPSLAQLLKQGTGIQTPILPQPNDYIETTAIDVRDTPINEPEWIDNKRDANRMVYSNPLGITRENLEALGLDNLIPDWEKGYKAMLRQSQTIPFLPSTIQDMGPTGNPPWIHDAREANRIVYTNPENITKENLESLGLYNLIPDWEKGMEAYYKQQARILQDEVALPSVPVAQMDAASKDFAQKLIALTILYTSKYFDQTFLELEILWDDINNFIINNIKSVMKGSSWGLKVPSGNKHAQIKGQQKGFDEVIDIQAIRNKGKPSTVDNFDFYSTNVAIGVKEAQEAYMELGGYDVGGISEEDMQHQIDMQNTTVLPKNHLSHKADEDKMMNPHKYVDTETKVPRDIATEGISEELKQQLKEQYLPIYQENREDVPDWILDIFGWQSAEGLEAERKRKKDAMMRSKNVGIQNQIKKQQKINEEQNDKDFASLLSFAIHEKNQATIAKNEERQRKAANVKDDIEALKRGQKEANEQIEKEYNKERVQPDIDNLTSKQQELEAQEQYKDNIVNTISTMKTFASHLDDTTKSMVEVRAFKIEALLQDNSDAISLGLLDEDTKNTINELVKDMVNIAELGYNKREARKDAQSLQAGVEFYESIENLLTVAQQITEQEKINEEQRNAAAGFTNIINTLDDIEKDLSIQRKNQEESLQIAEQLGPQLLETMKHQLGFEKERDDRRKDNFEQSKKDLLNTANNIKKQDTRADRVRAQYSHISGVNVNADYEGLSKYDKERMKLDHKYGKEYETPKHTTGIEDHQGNMIDDGNTIRTKAKIKREQSAAERIQRWSIDTRENIDKIAADTINKIGSFVGAKKGDEQNDGFQQASDKIDSVASKLTTFNDALYKAGEIFPPLTIAAVSMEKAMIGLTVASKALWFIDQLRLVLMGEETTAKEGSMAAMVLNTIATWADTDAETALTGARIIGTIQTKMHAAATAALNAIYAFIQSSFFLPVMITIAAIVAAIAAVKFWENKHAEALKESQKALEESTAKNNVALSQYKDLKKARENETDAMKKQQAARKEAIALYELEAARIQKRKAVHDEAKIRNDSIWGEYGLRASMQKMGLGFIAGGDFESQAENYEGTTKNIREIKEATLGNLFATSEQRQVASFYDNNSMFLAEIEAYKEPLSELYDKESKLIDQYGSIDLARGSKEFEDAVQEFATATGINGETAVKMLDWLETENKVNQAARVGQAEIGMIMARRQAKLMEIEYGDQYGTDFNDIGNAMLMAQFQEMMNSAKTEVWWDLLFSYLDAILTGLNPLNWVNGELSKKIATIGVNQETLNDLNEQGNDIYNDMLNAYNESERYDYNTAASMYNDAPFTYSLESDALSHAINQQDSMYKHTGQIFNDNEFLAIQEDYQKDTYGITSEQFKQEKNKKQEEKYNQIQASKKAKNTLEQLQNNGDMAHQDALDIIDAIKGYGVGAGGAGIGLSRALQNGDLNEYINEGIKGAVKYANEKTNFLGKAEKAYQKDGVRGVWEYGKEGTKKLGNRISTKLNEHGVNLKEFWFGEPYGRTGLRSKLAERFSPYNRRIAMDIDSIWNGKPGPQSGVTFKDGKPFVHGERISDGLKGVIQNTKEQLSVARGMIDVYGPKEGLKNIGSFLYDDIKDVSDSAHGKFSDFLYGKEVPTGRYKINFDGPNTPIMERSGGLLERMSGLRDTLEAKGWGAFNKGRTGFSNIRGRMSDFIYGKEVPTGRYKINFDGPNTPIMERSGGLLERMSGFRDTLKTQGLYEYAKNSKIATSEFGGLSARGLSGAATSEIKNAFNPKMIGSGFKEVGVGVKGGGTLLKGLGKLAGPATALISGATTFSEEYEEHDPSKKHYNADGSEKRAFQSTGEVAGSTGGSVVGALGGAAVGAEIGATVGSVVPGIGTAIGGIAGGIGGAILGEAGMRQVGDAIGGTIGWMTDEVIYPKLKEGKNLISDVSTQIFGSEDNPVNTVMNNFIANAHDLADVTVNAAGAIHGGLGNAWNYISGAAGNTWNAITGWFNGDNAENNAYANVDTQDVVTNTPASQSTNTIVIENININTEDDPEKIKTAFMNLMIELEEQITPRQVSKTIGAPSGTTNGNTEDTTTDNNNNNNNNNNQNPTV